MSQANKKTKPQNEQCRTKHLIYTFLIKYKKPVEKFVEHLHNRQYKSKQVLYARVNSDMNLPKFQIHHKQV